MAPLFHLAETRAWVRTYTHTVIREDEPDFARFAASGDGLVQRVLRVWLDAPCGDPNRPRAYLGSLTVSRACLRLRDLRRIFRRAEQFGSELGRTKASVHTELAELLRRNLGETEGELSS